MNQNAFTLFEIIIAMLVVGILSALAAPKVVELVNEARRGEEEYTVGNVKSGIALTYLGNVTRGITPQYPAQLDNAALAKASPNNPIYGTVLQHGITKDWEKLEALRYRGPTGQEYEYDPNDGTFEPVAALPPPTPPPIFSATFGGLGWAGGESILLTPDGGYIIAGETGSLSWEESNFYLAKLDAFGNIEWEKVYGETGWNFSYQVQKTSDGGYIIAGEAYSTDWTTGDAYLIKVDSSGTLQWENSYGGLGYDGVYSVQQTSDGGYIIAGDTNSFGAGGWDGYIVKIDSSGNTQWEKTYGGTNSDEAAGIQQTSDGGYIIAASTRSSGAGSYDAWLIKTDSSGTTQWEKTYGGTGWDYAWRVQQTPDEGYIMIGSNDAAWSDSGDFYIVKADSSGTTQWEKTYGGSTGDRPWDIQLTSDGGYVIAGDTTSFGAGGQDGYLVKIDSSGNTQWQKAYGGSDWDYLSSVQQTPDGGYAISGLTGSYGNPDGDAWLIKTDADGNSPEVTWSSP